MINLKDSTVRVESQPDNCLQTHHFLNNQCEQLSLLLSQPFSLFIYTQNNNIVTSKLVFHGQDATVYSLAEIDKIYNLSAREKPKNSQLKLIKLPSSKEIERAMGYIYPLDSGGDSEEYLLLLCRDRLSEKQQKIVELQARSIARYLMLKRSHIEQSNKADTLEHSLYSIGHELRSPLAHISVLTENIRLNSSENFRLEQINLIRQAISRLNGNLNYLLRSNKPKSSPLVEQDLRKVLRSSLKNLEYLIKRKKIKIEYPKNTAFLAIKPFEIEQIFDNLLNNAINFSPEGETITCDWQLFQDEILIAVCDRGCGLSSEDLKHLFTPFYSRRNGGTGLGLTLIKKIISDLRGNIWANNIPLGGTKFSVVLPRCRS